MIQKLRQESRVVEKRKVETKYGHFLRIAQKFYKGYIQRLSARYDIPELKRAARSIEAGEMDVKDMISPVPSKLAFMVLSSCHLTLIRLGDLARYRVQAKHKKSFDTALAFYGIAHDLIPDSGYAFHQKGIVSLEEGSHLDVIYHFYRAWAVKDPHPMARQNLEAKFKDAQKQNAAARGKAPPPSAYEALMVWFVRLHALIYKGEPISPQHTELEREVIHRLSMAAKDPNAEPMLLKMALVNMSACWIASAKYRGMYSHSTPVTFSDQEPENKSEKSKLFHQYILHFTTRFLLKLCEAMELDFKESLALQEADFEGQHEPEGKPSVVTTLLPVLRIYCIWIGACRSEIFTSPNAPAQVVPRMTQSLARVFTFLCTEIYKLSDTPASCPYLLPEDVETRGLRSFSDDQVPAPCRSYCAEDGKLKPYRDPNSEPMDPSRESIARILDLLRSAYFLAEDSTVPLTCGVVDGQVVFQYQTDGAPDDIQSKAEAPRMPEKATEKHQPGPEVNNTNGVMATRTPVFPSGPPPAQRTATGESSQRPSRRPTSENLYPMNDADKTVVNMLSPFLECPTPRSEQGGGTPQESSYGMHSTTANELAQELLKTFQPEKDEPVPYYESLSPGKFGSSTWNYFVAPGSSRGQVPGSTGQGAFFPRHGGSNHSSRGSGSLGGEPLDDPFTTPGRRAVGDLQPRTQSNVASPGISPAERSRNQLLQAFTAPGPAPPGSSTFSSWPANRNVTQTSNPWGHQASVGGPASSAASAFSHPNSLYQGTPNNAMSYGHPTYGNVGNHQMYNGTTQEGASSASRPFQMDDTASSYDAAILQAAWQGSK